MAFIVIAKKLFSFLSKLLTNKFITILKSLKQVYFLLKRKIIILELKFFLYNDKFSVITIIL